MKKVLFVLPLLVAALTGCSKEDITPVDPDGAGETHYMAVTIATSSTNTPMGMQSRAEGDYEHGEEFESAVSTLDFYFFDANGNPSRVKADGTNHLNVTPAPTNTPENENISNAINAVLVISTKLGDAIPEQIVAVVNKGQDSEGIDVNYNNMSITDLQNELTQGRGKKNGFVMTNSVYVAGNALQIGAHVAGHLHTTEDAALANPVTIYVERALAKVRTRTSITEVTLENGTVVYDPQDEKGYGDGATAEDNKIYVKFLGWNTTATSTKNRLVKVIDAGWNPGWIWNTADYHRSFWAVNADKNTYDYFKFEIEEGEDAEAVKPADGFKKFDGTDYTYIKENAAVSLENPGNPSTPSQVIIAAQLVDKNGAPVEFAEWAFQRMTVADLKKAFADALPLYYKEVVNDTPTTTTTVFTKIAPSEIELKTATEAGYLNDNNGRRYLVYGALTEDAAKKTWYGESRLDAEALSAEKISETFLGLGGAKVWTGGRTYYYFDIQHHAYGNENAQFGQFGVVRNHVYDANVNGLKGLGTPVYNPEEVIIPEKPEDDYTFIAAEVKVLSWRVVNFNVNLDWK